MAEAEDINMVVGKPMAEEASNTDYRMIWPVLGVKRRQKVYILHPVVNLPGCVSRNTLWVSHMKNYHPTRVLANIHTTTVALLCDFSKLAESLQAYNIAVNQPPNILTT